MSFPQHYIKVTNEGEMQKSCVGRAAAFPPASKLPLPIQYCGRPSRLHLEEAAAIQFQRRYGGAGRCDKEEWQEKRLQALVHIG